MNTFPEMFSSVKNNDNKKSNILDKKITFQEADKNLDLELTKEMENALSGLKVEETVLAKGVLENNPEYISKYIFENFKNSNGEWFPYSKMKTLPNYGLIVQLSLDLVAERVTKIPYRNIQLDIDKMGKIDGIVGIKTRQAVKDMQNFIGIKEDGYAGPEFFANISSIIEGKPLGEINVEGYEEYSNNNVSNFVSQFRESYNNGNVESFKSEKIIDAKDIPFFNKELDGISAGWGNTIGRSSIIFKKGETGLVLYRPPGVLSYGREYDDYGTISRTKNGKKTIINNIENDFIYRKSEVDSQLSAIGSSNSGFEFPEIGFERRKKDYLEQNGKMSSKFFKKYFGKDSLEMQDGQGNIGNCYLVAALRSLMESPNYETLIRTSVKIEGPSDNRIATVRIPLGSKKGKDYKVFKDELLPQKNKFYVPGKKVPPQTVPLQKVRRNKKTNSYYPLFKDAAKKVPNIMTKHYEYYKALKGPTGMKILEMAYLKLKTKNNNDLISGGVDRLKMEGGYGDKAVIDLIGESQGEKETVGKYGKKSILKQGNTYYFKANHYFDNFHKSRDYGTLASLVKEGKNDSHFYKVPSTNQKIYYTHAYTIIDTDPLNKTVKIINPHKTNRPFVLTYKQTCDAFSLISGVGVDFDDAFKDK